MVPRLTSLSVSNVTDDISSSVFSMEGLTPALVRVGACALIITFGAAHGAVSIAKQQSQGTNQCVSSAPNPPPQGGQLGGAGHGTAEARAGGSSKAARRVRHSHSPACLYGFARRFSKPCTLWSNVAMEEESLSCVNRGVDRAAPVFAAVGSGGQQDGENSASAS